MRLILRLILLVVASGLGLAAFAYWTAVADPVVREARVALPGWPEGAPPVRAVLISDLHVAGPDMPPSRLARIVGRINALAPDLVLIAGDMVSDKRVSTRHYSHEAAMAPLGGLRPRLGSRALAAAGVTVLDNQAAAAGPLAIGGLDDDFTDRADLPATLAAMRRLPGARILLSHSPDPFPDVPAEIGLVLAGHTHCGQVRLPFIGAPQTMSDYGQRYACGVIRENGRTLIVTAGLGTSGLPLRLGAVPDLWLVTIGPARH